MPSKVLWLFPKILKSRPDIINLYKLLEKLFKFNPIGPYLKNLSAPKTLKYLNEKNLKFLSDIF